MLLGKISGRNVAGKNFRKKCCCEKFQEEMLLGKISGRNVAGKNFRKKCCWEKNITDLAILTSTVKKESKNFGWKHLG